MKDIDLEHEAITYAGALDLSRTPTGLTPRRLPAWSRPQIPDIFMDVVVQMPSGVRMRCATSSDRIELDVMLTLLQQLPHDLRPAVFDVLVDGALVHHVASSEGNVFALGDGGPSDIEFRPGQPTTIVIDGLGSNDKVVEIWLPQAVVVELRALRIENDAPLGPAPSSGLPRWVHYGSSISHCLEADSPTGIWPAVAAQEGGVDLVNLGLAGQCMLDQFVARTMRDLPSDLISIKVGINVVNGDTLRQRTFGPALHGFLDTIREGQPDTPILLVSPIFCPSAEDRPGPTVMGPNGRYVTVPGLEEIRLTCLTLMQIREIIESIVEVRRGLGDTNLHYLDGLLLFGPDDAGDLPDDLHPDAAGYARLGHRFAAHAFAPGGPLGRGG